MYSQKRVHELNRAADWWGGYFLLLWWAVIVGVAGVSAIYAGAAGDFTLTASVIGIIGGTCLVVAAVVVCVRPQPLTFTAAALGLTVVAGWHVLLWLLLAGRPLGGPAGLVAGGIPGILVGVYLLTRASKFRTLCLGRPDADVMKEFKDLTKSLAKADPEKDHDVIQFHANRFLSPGSGLARLSPEYAIFAPSGPLSNTVFATRDDFTVEDRTKPGKEHKSRRLTLHLPGRDWRSAVFPVMMFLVSRRVPGIRAFRGRDWPVTMEPDAYERLQEWMEQPAEAPEEEFEDGEIPEESIRFTCACGKTFRAPARFAGKKAKCPSCGEVLTVPVPSEPTLDAVLSAARKCPTCGAKLSQGASFCVQCGSNVDTEPERSLPAAPILAGFGLAAVVMVALFVWGIVALVGAASGTENNTDEPEEKQVAVAPGPKQESADGESPPTAAGPKDEGPIASGQFQKEMEEMHKAMQEELDEAREYMREGNLSGRGLWQEGEPTSESSAPEAPLRITMFQGGQKVWEGTLDQFQDLCRRYLGNPRETARLRDARYVLTGPVRAVHAPGGPFDRVMLGQAGSRMTWCICRRDQAQAVKKLKRGQKVTLEGRVKTIGGVHLVSSQFEQCVVQSVE